MSMNEGIAAIIRRIDEDSAEHSENELVSMKVSLDREIEREDALYIADLEQRREVLLANNRQNLRHRLERYSRRLNRGLLTYRRALLDEIFDMAAAKLSRISEEEYSEIFMAATRDLNGCFTLRLGELSADKLGPRIVEYAMKLNPDLDIIISPDAIPGKSGFVIVDGRVEYSYLFEDLMEDKKSEQSAMILKEVFEDI